MRRGLTLDGRLCRAIVVVSTTGREEVVERHNRRDESHWMKEWSVAPDPRPDATTHRAVETDAELIAEHSSGSP
jgi:hypothetical protein